MSKRYEAFVTRNNDPERRGRIKVKCDQIVGNNEELPYWFEASLPAGSSGLFIVPGVGDPVEIELTPNSSGLLLGDVNPKWIGNIITETTLPEEVSEGYGGGDSPSSNSAKICGLWTKFGNMILLDDREDAESIKVVGGGKRVSLELDVFNETIRLDAARIILNGLEIWIGDPDEEGGFARIISRAGKKVL